MKKERNNSRINVSKSYMFRHETPQMNYVVFVKRMFVEQVTDIGHLNNIH